MNKAERLIRRFDRFQQKHAVLAVPWAVVQKFGNDQAGAFATRIAYRGLFSVFPLMLLLTTILGFVLSSNPAFKRQVMHSALSQFPLIGAQLKPNGHLLHGSGPALVVGVVGTVWGTLGVTNAAESAMNTVWNIPYVNWPSFVFRKLRSAAVLIALGIATIASASLSTFATAYAEGTSRPVSYLGSVLISLAVFTIAFTVLTAEPLGWRDVWLGAVLATAFWEVLQAAGGWYVARELRGATETYGVLAAVIVILSWMFLAAQVTLLAVEVNVVLKYRLWPRSITQPPLTEGDRKMFGRLARFEVRRPEYVVHVDFKPDANTDPLRNGPDSSTAPSASTACSGDRGEAANRRQGGDRNRDPTPQAEEPVGESSDHGSGDRRPRLHQGKHQEHVDHPRPS